MRKLRITLEQYNRLFPNKPLTESTDVNGGLNRVNKSFSANLSGKEVQNLAEEPFDIKAPVSGLPNSSMKRTPERKISENESNGPAEAIFEFIKHIWQQSGGHISSPFFEQMGLSWEQIVEFLVAKGIIEKLGDQDYRIKNFLKRKYSKDESGKAEKLKDIADVSKKLAGDPEAPWSKKEVMGEISMKEVDNAAKFTPVGMGRELSVLKGPDGYYVFEYDNIPREKLPNPEYVLNADDLAEFVNKNLDSIPKGDGLDGWNNEAALIRLDEPLKDLLNQLYSKDRAFLKALNSVNEMTSAASSGAFLGPMGGSDVVKRELDEVVTTVPTSPSSSSTGAYVQPAIWAKDKKNWKGDKKTQYPNGELVTFDDCTKLNNNKSAQNGKCSTGAVDSVVKTKKTKGSVISKSMYEQIAKKTGRSIEDVKRIIEANLNKKTV